MTEKTTIRPKTHPDLFKPGIITTNAPYRHYFYQFFNLSDLGTINIEKLTKNGIHFCLGENDARMKGLW